MMTTSTTKAILVRPHDRAVVPIDWDLSNVPHADLRHADETIDHLRSVRSPGADDALVSAMRCVAYGEGCDSRNHVLASRTLHGRDDRLLQTTAYTIRMKHDERWLAWVHDDIDRGVQQDGFIVVFRRTLTRIGPFFGDGIIVLYRSGSAAAIRSGMSAAEAERAMGQPVAFDASRIEIEWMRDVPEQIWKDPIPTYRVNEPSSSSPFTTVQTCMPPNVCTGCGGHFDKLSRCGACGAACYCTKECQRKDWPRHKAACKARSKR